MSALVIAIVAQRIRIAPAVMLVACGAIAAALFHLRLPFDFGPAVLFIFLPPLIFEAAWSIELRALRARLELVLVLAFVGAIACAFAVAGATAAIGGLQWAPALILVAISWRKSLASNPVPT